MFELSPWMLVISGVAMAVMNQIKVAFPEIPKRVVPLCVTALCIGGALLIPEMVWKVALLNGLVGGLSATGVYSSQKAVRGK